MAHCFIDPNAMTVLSSLDSLSLTVYSCELKLRPTAYTTGQRSHVLSILEAVIKGMTEHANLGNTLRPQFLWPDKHVLNMRFNHERAIPLRVDLYGADRNSAELWLANARQYFLAGQPGRNFAIDEASGPVAVDLSALALEIREHDEELCLDFITPFPFQTKRGKPRFWLDSQGVAKALALRIKKLFDISVHLPSSDFQVLPYYWSYCQISHASHSQPGHTKFLNGCVGRLYLKASRQVMADWLPWLTLAEYVGIGGQCAFGMGRFRLLRESPAYFQGALINPSALEKAVRETLEHYDEALTELATNPAGVETVDLAKKLAEDIKDGWRMEPYRAFRLSKPHGGFRIAEKAMFHDLIIQKHLLNLLTPILDKTFEEESIGFRKGLSREIVIKRLNEALRDGFDYVLESDIADFFPSVDLSVLQAKLDALLPVKDVLLRQILAAILYAPRELNGMLEARLQGLAVGSALSPLLANLYLDAFDEHIKAHGVRLVRYADDFIILTRGVETAESLLDVAEHSLKGLGLRLNLDKTAIRPISDGFVFLGIRFGGDADGAVCNTEHPDTMRKPVYITEPFVFLGVADDMLEVRKSGSVLTHIPLRRVSEILTLGPCMWSSQLAARASAMNVPIVLTAGNGKHVATIGGGAAGHYQVAYRQADKFYAMSDVQRLAIAKAFASGKINNYASLIRQRYQPGDNTLLAELKDIADEMWAAPNANVLRGLEGLAARKSFARVTSWIKSPDFVWHGRKRRPPDRLNSMLNFGYHLLFCRINVLVRGEGLNPYLSFLHDPNEQYETLVCDIQELFRPHVDRLVVRLLNLKMIESDDFDKNDKGYWLTHEAKQKFLDEFSRELDHAAPLNSKATLNESLALQVRSVKNFFLKDSEIQIFDWTL